MSSTYQTISTEAELEALANWSVVMDGDFDVWQKRGGHWTSYETSLHESKRLARYSPFVVLHEGRASNG